MELGLGPGDPPVEACSPTVQALYARHLGKVEEALTALPDSASLWQVWLRMSGVAGKHRGRSLVRGLTVPPPELGMEWPPQAVVAALARDARASGDWGMLRELLQPFWERWKARVDREKGRAKDAPPGPPVDWSTGLGPLLEAFLRGASEGEATELAQSLAALPEARPLLERAVALASACGRQDLARRWSAFRR
jgi:hypothetical protein